MQELGPVNRWAASRSSARRAATAMLVQELRRGRLFFFGGAITLGLFVLFMTAGRTDSDHDPVVAFLSALGLTAFLVGSAVGIAQLQRRRVFRLQLQPGLEMTSQFGRDFVLVGRQWAESTLQFDGFSAVEVAHGWVLLRRRGAKVQVMLPLELFPADDLARLRMVVAGYQPREPEDHADG